MGNNSSISHSDSDSDNNSSSGSSSGIHLLNEDNNLVYSNSSSSTSTKTPSPVCTKPNKKLTPNTKNTICAVSRVDFGNIVIEYLNNKKINKYSSYNVFNKAGYEDISTNNYLIIFFEYVQERMDIDDLMAKINKFFDEDFTNMLIDGESLNRRTILKFFDEIFGTELNETKKLRLAIEGKELSDMTQKNENTRGKSYEPFSKENANEVLQCSPEEIEGIKTVMEGRYNYNNKNNCTNLMFFLNKPSELTISPKSSQLLEVHKNTVYNDIINKNNGIDRQKAGDCWICKKPIYHYSYWCTVLPHDRFNTETDKKTKKNGMYVYLNNKAGEDEHVFPPTIGDIIGTINTEGTFMRDTIDDTDNKEKCLFNYGLYPSHAFCNQLKSYFLLSGLIPLSKQIDNNKVPETISFVAKEEAELNEQWNTRVAKWFSNNTTKNHSFEWVPNVKDGKTEGYIFPSKDNTVITATDYANKTFSVMKNTINNTIVNLLEEQATDARHNIITVLKLKILLYGIHLMIKLDEGKKAKWDKDEGKKTKQDKDNGNKNNSKKRSMSGSVSEPMSKKQKRAGGRKTRKRKNRK